MNGRKSILLLKKSTWRFSRNLFISFIDILQSGFTIVIYQWKKNYFETRDRSFNKINISKITIIKKTHKNCNLFLFQLHDFKITKIACFSERVVSLKILWHSILFISNKPTKLTNNNKSKIMHSYFLINIKTIGSSKSRYY